MRINVHSISAKLIFGGVVAVMVPLIIVGYLSFSKSHDALLELSETQALGIASDLAHLTRQVVQGEMEKARTMANQRSLRELGKAVSNSGVAANQQLVGHFSADLKREFHQMGDHYQGVFITTNQGDLYTGVLENGSEYKGINVADQTYFKEAKCDGVDITHVIKDVNEVVASIATAVEEQSAATKDIASNVAQASQGIQEVNENVNQCSMVTTEISQDIAGVSVSMSEMSTSSSQVNISAQELSKLSENLKQMVDQFNV